MPRAQGLRMTQGLCAPFLWRVNMSSNTRMAEVCRRLEREGFTISRTGGGHLRFQHPEMNGPVFAPSTPSDQRSIANLYALVRRKIRELDQ